MGNSKDLLLEKDAVREDKKLARILGISYDEFLQLDYDILTDETDDGFAFSYIFQLRGNPPIEILNKIVGLENGNRVWIDQALLLNNSYYEAQYGATFDNKNPLLTLRTEIENLAKLNELEIEDKNLENILKRQIFIGTFGTLETFLSDTFINLTLNNDSYFRNFIESYPEFRQRKFELREIFYEKDQLKDTVTKVMLDIIYHDLPKVREMYMSTFKINFPELKTIISSIKTRHDLVHRNGKTKDGDSVKIDKVSIIDLTNKVNAFVEKIAIELKMI